MCGPSGVQNQLSTRHTGDDVAASRRRTRHAEDLERAERSVDPLDEDATCRRGSGFAADTTAVGDAVGLQRGPYGAALRKAAETSERSTVRTRTRLRTAE